jgi:hypothetical protein
MPDADGDRAVLAAMVAAGSNLSKPSHTIPYLYFKSMSCAEAAGQELRAQGYSPVATHRTPVKSLIKRLFGPHTYSCIAETQAVPEEAAVLATSQRMRDLASRHGGEYDGWEASIER